MKYVLSQIFAVLGMLFLASSYLTKNKRVVLLLIIVSPILYSLHYLLLGALTGAILNVASIIRTIWYYYLEKKDLKNDWASLIIFEVIFLALGIVTWTGTQSILPILAHTALTFAVWKPQIIYYKVVSLTNECIFITYDFLIGSMFGMCTEVILLFIALFGLVYYLTKQTTRDKNFSTIMRVLNDKNFR